VVLLYELDVLVAGDEPEGAVRCPVDPGQGQVATKVSELAVEPGLVGVGLGREHVDVVRQLMLLFRGHGQGAREWWMGSVDLI